MDKSLKILRRVWRYQRGHQNPYIEKEQTTEKGQKGKQRSTKHTYKAKDRVTYWQGYLSWKTNVFNTVFIWNKNVDI